MIVLMKLMSQQSICKILPLHLLGGFLFNNLFIIMYIQHIIRRILKEELGETKSNYEKQVAVLKKLFKTKSYEGVCRYIFTHDKDNDRVAGLIVIFSSDWYRKSEEQKYLNMQLMKIQMTKQDIRQIVEKFLGMENLYVGSYLEDCDSSLN